MLNYRAKPLQNYPNYYNESTRANYLHSIHQRVKNHQGIEHDALIPSVHLGKQQQKE